MAAGIAFAVVAGLACLETGDGHFLAMAVFEVAEAHASSARVAEMAFLACSAAAAEVADAEGFAVLSAGAVEMELPSQACSSSQESETEHPEQALLVE